MIYVIRNIYYIIKMQNKQSLVFSDKQQLDRCVNLKHRCSYILASKFKKSLVRWQPGALMWSPGDEGCFSVHVETLTVATSVLEYTRLD